MPILFTLPPPPPPTHNRPSQRGTRCLRFFHFVLRSRVFSKDVDRKPAAMASSLSHFRAYALKVATDRFEFRAIDHGIQIHRAIRNMLRAGAQKVAADAQLQLRSPLRCAGLPASMAGRLP